MKVEVKDGGNRTYFFRYVLKENYRLSFQKTGKYTGVWKGNVTAEQCKNLEAFCNKNRLKFNRIEKQFNRSHDYKKIFFENNHGFFNEEKYFHCAYCGRILKRSDVTVDHVISIQKVKSSQHKMFYRRLMFKLNIKNINESKNLVASCKKCNSSKGAKAGLWILRGFIGRYYICWIIFYLCLALWIIYIWSKYGNILLN